MPLPLVIVNPASAGGSTGNAWPKIASELRTHFGPFAVAITSRPNEATELAARAARKTGLLIACGGDGTISEVANGILASGQDVILGILPSGTGGDFRRTLGIPTRTRDAARILHQGKVRAIDVGRINFQSPEGRESIRYFVGVASFGMSAQVVRRVKQRTADRLPIGLLTGPLNFGISTLQTSLETAPIRVRMRLDDQREQRLSVLSVCIANGRYFGGGMKIAPDAALNDGKFNVVSIGALSTTEILRHAPRLYAGSHLGLSKIDHALAEKIVATTDDGNEDVSLEIDGELPGRLPATFQIVPRSLRVVSNI